MFNSLHILRAPGLSAPNIFPGHNRPCFCSLEALVPGFSLQTDVTNVHLFSIFFLPFCHISGSLSNQEFTLGKQTEGDRQAEIQGEKDELL